MVNSLASVLYVNPASGQNDNPGTAQAPLKTLTAALKRAQPGTIIQLSGGRYQADMGEQFPCKVGAGVTVAGQGEQTIIQGGGAFASQEFGQQTVTVVLADRAQLRHVTITNPLEQGTGVWIDQGSPVMVRNRFLNCKRDGVLVIGNAMPILIENEFLGNGASGLFMVRQAKGEVRQNSFRQTGYGIAISDQAAPLLIDNRVSENRSGVVISRSASPVLRRNQVERNQGMGLWVQDTATPDLGQRQDLGQNLFRDNQTWDLRNDTSRPLAIVGNQLNPTRVSGLVSYEASQLPDPAAIPAILLGRVTPQPQPQPQSPASGPPPLNLNSRFSDVVGHWAAPFIDPLAAAGLVQGFFDGSFKPDVIVTRAQFAALVMAAFPSDGPDARRFQPFIDVANNFWARTVIYKAQAQGFLSGFPDNSFRPDAPMTRVQALVALASGLRLPTGSASALMVYQDRAQIPTYALEKVAATTQRYIGISYPDAQQLRPLEPITRAETAALVYQALVAVERMPLVTSPFGVASPEVAANFTDVGQHWGNAFIEGLAAQNLMSGFEDGSFRPDAPISRAQFATLVVKAFHPQPQRPATNFRDVPPDFWAAESIQRAYQAGFLSGFPDYTFAPDHSVLKLQVWVALVNGLKLTAKSPPQLESLTRYRDRNTIPTYGEAAIATATQLGLVFNYPDLNLLTPNRVASRAEVAAIVYQMLVLLDKATAIVCPYQVSATLPPKRP